METEGRRRSDPRSGAKGTAHRAARRPAPKGTAHRSHRPASMEASPAASSRRDESGSPVLPPHRAAWLPESQPEPARLQSRWARRRDRRCPGQRPSWGDVRPDGGKRQGTLRRSADQAGDLRHSSGPARRPRGRRHMGRNQAHDVVPRRSILRRQVVRAVRVPPAGRARTTAPRCDCNIQSHPMWRKHQTARGTAAFSGVPQV